MNENKFKKIIVIGLIITFISCSEDLVGPAPSGAYLYKGYDSLGTKVVEGWLTMDFEDSTNITGQWFFKKIGNQNIGPQDGGGKLVGGQNEDITWISLNPDVRDNNIHLRGTIKNNRYSGKWIWGTVSGITNHGTFEANNSDD
ncbi:MAG: hypothetical protein ABFS12_06175 [Bacteroidota bacterium]